MDTSSAFVRAWILEPSLGPLAPLPAWPDAVSRLLGSPEAGAVDPMHRVLVGPLPRGTIARSVEEEGSVGLFGDGDMLGLVVVARGAGTLEEVLPGLQSRVDRRVDVERLAAEPGWRLIGVVEVTVELESRLPPEPTAWAHGTEEGGVRVERVRGSGDGHLAFAISGTPSRESEAPVVEQRVASLVSGWRARGPALLTYGALALRFDRLCARMVDRAAVAEGLADSAGVVISAALGGGKAERLAARKLQLRLDAIRVPLLEDSALLEGLLPRLRDEGARLFGPKVTSWGDGCLVEVNGPGERTSRALRGKAENAVLWSEILGRAAS